MICVDDLKEHYEEGKRIFKVLAQMAWSCPRRAPPGYSALWMLA